MGGERAICAQPLDPKPQTPKPLNEREREHARLWWPTLGREPSLVTTGSPTGCFVRTSFMGLVQQLGLFWDGSLLDYGCQFWEKKPSLVTNGSPTGCFLKTSFTGLVQQLGLFCDGSMLDYGCQFWKGSQVLQLTDRQPDAF